MAAALVKHASSLLSNKKRVKCISYAIVYSNKVDSGEAHASLDVPMLCRDEWRGQPMKTEIAVAHKTKGLISSHFLLKNIFFLNLDIQSLIVFFFVAVLFASCSYFLIHNRLRATSSTSEFDKEET